MKLREVRLHESFLNEFESYLPFVSEGKSIEWDFYRFSDKGNTLNRKPAKIRFRPRGETPCSTRVHTMTLYRTPPEGPHPAQGPSAPKGRSTYDFRFFPGTTDTATLELRYSECLKGQKISFIGGRPDLVIPMRGVGVVGYVYLLPVVNGQVPVLNYRFIQDEKEPNAAASESSSENYTDEQILEIARRAGVEDIYAANVEDD